MITTVTSRENKIIKTVRSLHRKKGREQTGLYFAEGVRLVKEAVSYIPDKIKYIIMSESYAEKNGSETEALDKEGKIIYITDDKMFCDVCDTQTPQGIAAVLEIPEDVEYDVSGMEYVLILDGVSEPGNMGTIIRTAEAAGIELIMLLNGCTDVYAPKVVRSAMGSLFRMRFSNGDIADIAKLKESGFTVASTALYNSIPIEDADISGKRAIVIGNEAHGVSDAVIGASDMAVRLDMCGKVESLNAAVAAGIAMYMLKG